jgi:hypothetical protein
VALMSRFVPTFDHLDDDELHRQLHCWEHCALVSFRTQRQLAKMHVRHLREEIGRRAALRALAGGPVMVTFPETTAQDDARA